MNHCSEEQLLALLDGELSAPERARVEQHVEECWNCRTARNALEEDIANVVQRFRAAEPSNCPDPVALARILSACEPPPRRSFGTPARMALAAGLLACLVLILLYRSPRPEPATPESAAQRAAVLESIVTPGAGVAEQSLTATIQQTRPTLKQRRLRLHVYSDLVRARSSVHVDEAQLILASAHGVTKPMPDLLVDELDVESGLLRWFESRAPRPLSLASCLIDFAEAHSLRISWQGSWLVAERTDGRRRIGLRLELDSNGAPISTAVRLESQDRAWEVNLRAEHSTAFLPGPAAENLFTRSAIVRAVRTEPLPTAPEPITDLAAVELEARYALHRAGLDRGQFEYLREGPALRVRATPAGDTERKAWESALAGRSNLRLDFEVAARAPSEEVVLQAAASDAVPALDATIRKHFLEEPGDERERGERMSAWLNKVVGASQDAMRAAWGLRRVAERYHDVHGLRTEQRWLIEAMVRDHLDGLDRALTMQRSLLEPVLGPAGESTGTAVAETARWDDACLRVFRRTEKSQETLLPMLTGGTSAPIDVDDGVKNVLGALAEWPGLRVSTEQILKQQFGSTRGEP